VKRAARVQLRILCEDTRTADFLSRVCEAWGLSRHEVRFVPRPPGRGDAKQWIRTQYAGKTGSRSSGEIRWLRSKTNHLEVGLLVVIDGDDVGPAVRKRELDDALVVARHARRGKDERVAIFVPTWSIETWLLWLWGQRELNEERSYKEDARTGATENAALFRKALSDPDSSSSSAARAWKTAADDEAERLPSLADARAELMRLPLP
jgi:hypothetical protein